MTAMFVGGLAVVAVAEQHGSPVLRTSGVNLATGNGQSGGNMSDKEVRFGIANSALFETATTASSDGAVNSGLDAFTPAGGAVPLANTFLGEVIFGGAGSGLYSMIFMIVIAVFVAGLLVGRTPEYLGKKLEEREIKLAVLGALFVPTFVLALTSISIVTHAGLASVFNPGAHGFTEALYAWTSMANTNGSAFAGYGATNLSAALGAVAMVLGRFVPLLAALALAGSVATKRRVPASVGTFRTDGPPFAVLLVGVILLIAGLELLPALSLGPVAEGLAH
jgi:K+-transporting ATPase ATPase A chain